MLGCSQAAENRIRRCMQAKKSQHAACAVCACAPHPLRSPAGLTKCEKKATCQPASGQCFVGSASPSTQSLLPPAYWKRVQKQQGGWRAAALTAAAPHMEGAAACGRCRHHACNALRRAAVLRCCMPMQHSQLYALQWCARGLLQVHAPHLIRAYPVASLAAST